MTSCNCKVQFTHWWISINGLIMSYIKISHEAILKNEYFANNTSVILLLLIFFFRMIILWPAFLFWATRSPFPQSLKISTRTTSSNCISSPTSTISDRRVNTLLRGKECDHPDARLLDVFAVLLSPGRQRIDKKPFSARRWMEVIRSATIPSSGARVLNSKESHPHWVGSPCFHTLSPSGDICPSCPPRLSAFLFYTYLGHLYMCPCTFCAF